MIIKYIYPHQLFGNKYVVRLNNGTSEEIAKSAKVFEAYDVAQRYDEMILLFGLEETMIFCKLNAWKYRTRATKKGSEKEDLDKANWYILKYQELEKRKL